MIARGRPIRFRYSLRVLLLAVTGLCVALGVPLHRARKQLAATQAIWNHDGHVVYDYQLTPTGDVVYDYQLTPTGDPIRPPWEPQWLLDLVGIDFFHQVHSASLSDYDSEPPFKGAGLLEDLPHLRSLSLRGTQANDEAMQRVDRMASLEKLSIATKFTFLSALDAKQLQRPTLTDRSTAHLFGLRKLRVLEIEGSHLGDAALETIGRLKQLEELRLDSPLGSITDEGLRHLKNLPHLRRLELCTGTGAVELSDAGMTHLQGLERLERLSLRGEKISDRGLECLASLKNLKEVTLATDSVTSEGARRFKEAMPGTALTLLNYETVFEVVQAMIARRGRLELSRVTPESVFQELMTDERDREKLIALIQIECFIGDRRGADAFAERVAARSSVTLAELSALIHECWGVHDPSADPRYLRQFSD